MMHIIVEQIFDDIHHIHRHPIQFLNPTYPLLPCYMQYFKDVFSLGNPTNVVFL